MQAFFHNKRVLNIDKVRFSIQVKRFIKILFQSFTI